MAVPNSGELKLKDDILLEVKMNSTGSDPTGPNNNPSASLHQMSIESQFSTPDAMGDFYGYVSAEPPTVVSCTFTGISDTSMTARGHVANPAGVTTCYGFYFGTSTNRTSNPFYGVSNTTSVNRQYTRGFGSLNPTTTYRHWAYACNVAGTAVGNRCDATTLTKACYCSAETGNQYVFVAGEPVWNPNLNNNVCNTFDGALQFSHVYFGFTNMSNYSRQRAKNNSGTLVNNNASGCYTGPATYNDTQSSICAMRLCGTSGPQIAPQQACVVHRNQRSWNVQTYGYATTNFTPTYLCVGFINFLHQRIDPNYANNCSFSCNTPGMDATNPRLVGAWAVQGSLNSTFHFKSCTATGTGQHGLYNGVSSDIRLKTNINYL